MLSNELGFITSWKMLTRDKGWIKPVLLLTLVGWIPILGQIVVLGYGLEWARLTAWGIDAAPKQRGVDYSKVLATGGIAFLVNLSMSIIVAILSSMVFGTTFGIAGLFGPIGSLFSNAVSLTAATGGVVFGLVAAVVNIFMSTFVLAACLRATIYDGFSAGWRVDRLFQMVMKDPGGFFHAYAVKLIGDIVIGAYSAIVSLFGMLFALGGMAGIMAYGYGIDHFRYDLGRHLLDSLITMGPGLVMVVVLLVIAALFFGGVLTVAMQLVSINAMGQWFCRFDVNRWGTSSAPLPDGVPVRPQSAVYGDGSIPQQPVDARGSEPQPEPVRPHVDEPAPDVWSPSRQEAVPTFMEYPPVLSEDVARTEGPDEEKTQIVSHPAIPLPPISDPSDSMAGEDDLEGVSPIQDASGPASANPVIDGGAMSGRESDESPDEEQKQE